ncbi:SagB/ThcOx family dehydrogenase [Thiohalocapsa marina]|nr:SagB/ThcOx family dehydrogenase [Thiohalocapsa marina]
MAEQTDYALPPPTMASDVPLQAVLRGRRTVRAFAPRPIALTDVAQLLWAAQGITSDRGLRTAPSAGALYPLELHLVAGEVEGLPAGSYRYSPRHHRLRLEVPGDLRAAVAATALQQDWLAQAPALVVAGAVEARTMVKYGERGIRYVHMEVGHASQNLLLQAVASGLGGATVGAFNDARLKHLLKLPKAELPLLILAVGHPR